MYVRTVLYVQYLIFLKTRKISEDLPICYRIRAVHGSRPFRAGPNRIAGRLELDRTHIHRGSVVKSWPKFCKVRDCGVCRARRSRGGLFPLAYFAFKGDWPEFAKIWNSDRNSQNFAPPARQGGGSAPPLTPPAAPRRLDLGTPARDNEFWFVKRQT